MQYKKEVLHKAILKQHPELESTEYIKDLLTCVWDELKDWSMNPTNLIMNVKGLGIFYWKHKALKRDYHFKYTTEEENYKRSDEHRRFMKVAEKVLKMYEVFLEKKMNVRKMNYGDDYKTPEELTIIRRNFLNLNKKDNNDDNKNTAKNPKKLI